MTMRSFSSRILLGGLVLVAAGSAIAETTDFGGFSERFKGGGDKIPPRCQIDVPTASAEPFFVKWNCTDDNAASQEIRSELWLYRKGAPTGELIANFLGFPASVRIDEGLLGVGAFAEGLPISLKLLARDRAGITTISPSFVVRAQDNTLNDCDLTIETAASESNGDTTGTPSETVSVTGANVNVSQTGDNQLSVSTAGSVLASPCEINAVCFDNSRLTFSASLTLEADGTSSGAITVVPGSIVASVKGTTTVDGVNLKALEVSGETTVDGTNATVTLSCNR